MTWWMLLLIIGVGWPVLWPLSAYAVPWLERLEATLDPDYERTPQ